MLLIDGEVVFFFWSMVLCTSAAGVSLFSFHISSLAHQEVHEFFSPRAAFARGCPSQNQQKQSGVRDGSASSSTSLVEKGIRQTNINIGVENNSSQTFDELKCDHV
jgi:hypothetical protein